jgi:MerR, DNA binding
VQSTTRLGSSPGDSSEAAPASTRGQETSLVVSARLRASALHGRRVAAVAVVTFLQEVGFTLAETKRLMASRKRSPVAWRALAVRKSEELRHRIEKDEAALQAIEHSLVSGGLHQPEFVVVAQRRGVTPVRRASSAIVRSSDIRGSSVLEEGSAPCWFRA